MEQLLHLFIMIPVLGLAVAAVIPERQEKAIAAALSATMGLQLAASLAFTAAWLWAGSPQLYLNALPIYQAPEGDYDLVVDFYFDRITAVYLVVGALLTFLVTLYSRTYLHREAGYKRFFETVMLFYVGYTLTAMAGNWATLFMGWEVAGLASFLLIAFYRNRYLPVKNAVKVFSLYRIGDFGLILALWASHHIWHKNVLLLEFNQHDIALEHIEGHYGLALFFSAMVVLAAAVKSAQLPFSSWLPRAMEGPTPSSAIFYGSLSVHIGVLILLRASHFWENLWEIQWAIGLLGASTFLAAGMASQVQSSVKGQIAYASVSQIGLIFIEVALGWERLALAHFAGNAFLRTYQLLISPSSVTYLIREQFYRFVPGQQPAGGGWLRSTLFMLSLKEWGLDDAMHLAWVRLKRFVARVSPLESRFALAAMGALAIGACAAHWQATRLHEFAPWLQLGFAGAWLLFSVRALAEVRSANAAWWLASGSHAFLVAGLAFNAEVGWRPSLLYLAGVGLSALLGHLALARLRRLEGLDRLEIHDYQGHCYEHPKLNLAMLLAMLGVLVSPITTAFIGLELLYARIDTGQYLLLGLATLGFLVNNLATIRIYAKAFLGPHVKTYHEAARRST